MLTMYGPGTQLDIGYGHFLMLRRYIMELIDPKLEKAWLNSVTAHMRTWDFWEGAWQNVEGATQEADARYEAVFRKLQLPDVIEEFLWASDAGAVISVACCKALLKLLEGKGDDDLPIYGNAYYGQDLTFHDFRQLLQDCTDAEMVLVWY